MHRLSLTTPFHLSPERPAGTRLHALEAPDRLEQRDRVHALAVFVPCVVHQRDEFARVRHFLPRFLPIALRERVQNPVEQLPRHGERRSHEARAARRQRSQHRLHAMSG